MDHLERVSRKQNPIEKVNILNRVTFLYTGTLFKRAFKNDLEEDDIYDVVKCLKSEKNGDKFEAAFKEQKTTKTYSLTRLLWKCFGVKFLMLGFVQLVWKIISSIYEPEAIGKLVSYFNPKQTRLTFNDALYYAFILIAIKFIHALYIQNYQIYMQTLGMQIRTSFCSLVYRKALRLTPAAMNEISLGNIITVITKDVNVFERSLLLFSEMGIELIKLFLTCYLIYNKMGWPGFVGILSLWTVVPAQVYIGKVIKNLRLDLSRKTDERLQATQETLSAIKIIKMYTWEKVFAQKVEEKRSLETTYLMKSMYLKTFNFIVGIFTSKVGLYGLIMTYIYVNKTVDAEVMFYVLKCFKDLRSSISILLPFALGKGAELIASSQRISKILNSKELDLRGSRNIITPKIITSNINVKVKNKHILRNISTEINPGLTVVTGPLGCGKSSLLKLFLKDFPIDEGKLLCEGSFSYCSQDPWMFPSSIKQNIVFGEAYDELRYQTVVKVCALEYDFNLFVNGDETIVADGGKNLSGGQQARINLARAIYKKSDIYLLDDPLHALDATVQDFIYQNCIKNFLKGQHCVLVTHNLRHKNDAETLIVMKDGEIIFDGKPNKVEVDILKEIETEEEELKKSGETDEDANETTKLIKEPGVGRARIYRETKKIGKVELSVYNKYFKFGGGILFFAFILMLMLSSEVGESYSTRMLTTWINIQQNLTNIKMENNTAPNSTVFAILEGRSDWLLNLYTWLICGSFVLDLFYQFLFVIFIKKASVNLHNTMIEKLTSSVMTFFDNYFIGNILNRFSQDLNAVDEQLPSSLIMFAMVLFEFFGLAALVSSVNWTFLVVAGVLVVLMYGLRTIYMPLARSLKRLEAATRSPLIGHLNASMEGVTTIRASKAEDILIKEFDRHQDLFTSAYYMSFCVKSAFGFFMNILSAFFVTFIIVKLLFFSAGEESGDVGLAITKAATLAALVQWSLMTWSELENNMTSVERVLEYTEVPQENYEGQVLEKWPYNGLVEYKNVSLTYKVESVLKEVSFEVKAKQKIGIVGRTGAGKSSIIATLFRLYNYEGVIKIDGVDIKTLSLGFFRNKISIIPQDPLLFQGTIRQNIDPLNRYSDSEIWDTLAKVHMKDHVSSLELTITDHGSNFSTGQRQLICLGRAIIKKNKIVVLDEATANMDPETEFLVQKTIADNFSDCTVFIIAHRLSSVLDCNKILVMEKGRVVEYADPLLLIENKDSFFAKMLASYNAHNAG